MCHKKQGDAREYTFIALSRLIECIGFHNFYYRIFFNYFKVVNSENVYKVNKYDKTHVFELDMGLNK